MHTRQRKKQPQSHKGVLGAPNDELKNAGKLEVKLGAVVETVMFWLVRRAKACSCTDTNNIPGPSQSRREHLFRFIEILSLYCQSTWKTIFICWVCHGQIVLQWQELGDPSAKEAVRQLCKIHEALIWEGNKSQNPLEESRRQGRQRTGKKSKVTPELFGAHRSAGSF